VGLSLSGGFCYRGKRRRRRRCCRGRCSSSCLCHWDNLDALACLSKWERGALASTGALQGGGGRGRGPQPHRRFGTRGSLLPAPSFSRLQSKWRPLWSFGWRAPRRSSALAARNLLTQGFLKAGGRGPTCIISTGGRGGLCILSQCATRGGAGGSRGSCCCRARYHRCIVPQDCRGRRQRGLCRVLPSPLFSSTSC